MNAANPTPRRGRPPKALAQLTRATVREAALTVIDSDGIAAVSMRSVSRLLGVDAKSLYHHVADKQTLLALMADGETWSSSALALARPGPSSRAGRPGSIDR